MKLTYSLIILLLACHISYAQTTQDFSVELTAAVQETPPQITLSWKSVTGTGVTSYHIWRKAKDATLWDDEIAVLGGSAVSYTDYAVVVDSAYEYQVIGMGGWPLATGYIYAGVKRPAVHNRGTLLLLVDSTFTDSCSADITTLMNDLSGDGWQIIRHDLSRSLADYQVRATVAADYASHTGVNAVFILGHLAVPYSGDYTADHDNHKGAYPADVYYSSLGTTWTDVTVNDVSSDYLPNHNVPGDGKWDQDSITAPALMQISRVDFYDMSFFPATEVQMMRSYLAKDHQYKMDALAVRHRALIYDNFGPFGTEAFAANGWRNFAPLVSRDSVYALPFISSLAAASFQWAYGCGGGTFSSAAGVGSSADFNTSPVNGVFTMLFGSFFGDWNFDNDFLKAPLCSPVPALTSCWGGRPNWFLHHMALGENIGYSERLTQNNDGGLYQPGGATVRHMHIELLGDLSLRTDYIQQVSNLHITSGYLLGANISWIASPDPAVIGYYVYRADSLYGYYQRVSPMLAATAFNDVHGTSGLKYYMVRPVKLQSSASGQYYNLGVGVTDTATVSFSPFPLSRTVNVVQRLQFALSPNPAISRLDVAVTCAVSAAADMYVADAEGRHFGDCAKQLKPGDNKFSFDIHSLVPGVYTLVINSGGDSFVKKWVKI